MRIKISPGGFEKVLWNFGTIFQRRPIGFEKEEKLKHNFLKEYALDMNFQRWLTTSSNLCHMSPSALKEDSIVARPRSYFHHNWILTTIACLYYFTKAPYFKIFKHHNQNYENFSFVIESLNY